ncbi:hypothetical protein ACOSP7_000193 [Xanthoceras sorbifolium]
MCFPHYYYFSYLNSTHPLHNMCFPSLNDANPIWVLRRTQFGFFEEPRRVRSKNPSNHGLMVLRSNSDGFDLRTQFSGFFEESSGRLTAEQFIHGESGNKISDTMLVVYIKARDGAVVEVCRTEVVLNSLNPAWITKYTIMYQFEILQTLLTPLVLWFLYSIGANSKLEETWLCFQNYDNFLFCSLSQFFPFSFLKFNQTKFTMTSSNVNPRLPDSLHYLDPSGRPNAYQRAILEVGELLEFYDTDRRFPAWDFGARPIDGPVSHCFNLNGSSNYCEVEGIQGIMMTYTSALHNDGVVTDLQETKDALVKASDLPLSILIVGVGGADFKEMEILDADKGERLESSSGRVATRDIVQFVPLKDVHGGEVSVIQELLAELPAQFLTYMRTREIQPST